MPEFAAGFFAGLCAIAASALESSDLPPPATQENRSPIARAPA
jgi:hypothetical protein